ncbi:hydrolase [Lithospermum erythrorhizon]|uniref:Hydrolase n=1 Tax=Lithospermum erythrorhizon TaxID=34254 RepID=A0AAV3PUH3_LITER
MSGPECSDNSPKVNSSDGGGSVIHLGGFTCYVSGYSVSKFAVILISDVYGFEAPLLRKIADKVAASGYYVVVPDFMNGDPYDHQNKERPLTNWLESHAPENAVMDAKSVIAALKSQGVTAVGAAGFCWGAKVVVHLGRSDDIQAAVLLHPTFCTPEDIKVLKAPIAVLGAEFDKISPPKLLKQFEEVLLSKPEVDGYVNIFPGVRHGWTVRYNIEDERSVKAAEEAHQHMLDWFNKYLKVRNMHPSRL